MGAIVVGDTHNARGRSSNSEAEKSILPRLEM